MATYYVQSDLMSSSVDFLGLDVAFYGDGLLGAVVDGQLGGGNAVWRHDPVPSGRRVALVVDVKQIGGEGGAAVVAHAERGVDMDLHETSPSPAVASLAARYLKYTS